MDSQQIKVGQGQLTIIQNNRTYKFIQFNQMNYQYDIKLSKIFPSNFKYTSVQTILKLELFIKINKIFSINKLFNIVTFKMDCTERANIISEQYNGDKNDALKIWCFGPDTSGANVLVNKTQEVQYLDEIKDSMTIKYNLYRCIPMGRKRTSWDFNKLCHCHSFFPKGSIMRYILTCSITCRYNEVQHWIKRTGYCICGSPLNQHQSDIALPLMKLDPASQIISFLSQFISLNCTSSLLKALSIPVGNQRRCPRRRSDERHQIQHHGRYLAY